MPLLERILGRAEPRLELDLRVVSAPVGPGEVARVDLSLRADGVGVCVDQVVGSLHEAWAGSDVQPSLPTVTRAERTRVVVEGPGDLDAGAEACVPLDVPIPDDAQPSGPERAWAVVVEVHGRPGARGTTPLRVGVRRR